MAEDGATQFERLYREHVSGLLAYALARTSPELALEAVESTFLVAWRRLGDVPAAPRPWLIGVTRRVLADQRRARSRRDALGRRMAAAGSAKRVGSDPADEVVARDRALVALGQLSDGDRELLCLVAWDGLSTAEAAEVLGCSATAAKVRLHRARRRFEVALSGDGDPPRLGVARTSTVHLPTQLRPLLPKEMAR